MQSPDPSLLNNGTTLPSAKWPAQLFTYSYDTIAQTLTTKQELGLVTNGPTGPSIDLSAPNVRKTQTIDNSSGETIEVERWVPGTSSPTSGSFILVSKSQYNSAGEKIHTWTPLGGSDATALTQTDFGYDSQSRLISTKNISGETKQEFDGYGNLVTTTDALNDMTKHSYDKLNRLLAKKEASGAQQSMTFNGRAKTHTMDENATTSIEYDLLGRVESRTPPGRGKIKYKYDTVGNLLSIENGEGLTTTWTYDSLNRPRTETDPNGFTTNKSYDLAGNLISVVDPLGHETKSVYDALNRLVSTTDALQHTTSMSYDASGNRLSLTDPDNNKTQWTYDSFDRVLTETNQLNNTRSYAYYSDGREKLLTKADGNQIRYTYDLAAHTSKEEWLNGSGAVTKTLDFQYDAVGDLLDASDSDSSVHWLYESGLLRQESLSLPNNIFVQFVNRYKDDVLQSVTTKLRGIQDSKVAYSYTADGLLEQIQQTGYNVSTQSVRYSYDQAARRTSVTRFTDVDNLTAVFQTDYRFTNTSDQQTDRLQSLKHQTALSSLVEYKFVWDAASRLTSVESPGGDGLSSFAYDTVNQLTGATYSSNISNLSFSYDSNGNRNNADNVPGVDNRQQSDSEWTYQYDDNGNLVRQTNKSNGSVVEYTFDVRNRLTDVSSRGSLGGPLSKGVHYGYDAINRRISRALDSNGDGSADVKEYFVNYGQRASRGGAGDELALVLKGDGEVKTRVLHGALVDEVLAEENVTSPTNRDVLWALADQQGSVRDLARVTNGQVQVVDHIQYDAFGNTVSETDTAIAHLYGYSGREFDKETGLQYNRARYYDPSTGRWMSKDPIGFGGGDTNLYRMTGNHPNMSNDPSGLQEPGKGIDWDASPLFNDVKSSGRSRLTQFRGMYHLAITEGRSGKAADILDAARSHASLHSSSGLHPDHDKFLKQDASVRSMQHGRFGQSVIATSNGIDYAGHQIHEGFEFAVDVKMILSSDAMVEGDQLIEVAPGVFERNRFLSPRETSYDKRLLAKMTLQAEIDITLAALTGGGSYKPGYGQLDDAWGYEKLIVNRAPSSSAKPQLNILNPSFTPKAPLHELLIEQASRRGFATGQSEALFWSGLGRGRDGILRSQKYAAQSGGRTLEMTGGGKYLDDLDLFGRNSPITQAQAMRVWEHASREFARGASGQVRAVTGSVRPSSVFNRVEYPELISNPHVWGIDVLYLLPRIGIR